MTFRSLFSRTGENAKIPKTQANTTHALVPAAENPRLRTPFRGFLYGGISLLFLAVGLSSFFTLQSLFPEISAVLHYAPPIALISASAVLAWNAWQREFRRCLLCLAAALGSLVVLFATIYLPVLDPSRPVKDLCKVIDAQAEPDDDAGGFRGNAPGMAGYLQRTVFDESDADALARRFQGPRRIFCIMTERDYDFFVGTKDMILYVLDRRLRFSARFGVLWNDTPLVDQELLVVSNRPYCDKGDEEASPIP